MTTVMELSLPEIESRVLDLVGYQLGIRRSELHPGLRLIEDLHCDSLDLVELFMELEKTFQVSFPDNPSDPIYKAVFTRKNFRLSDLAELVYLQQRSGEAGHRQEWTTAPAGPAGHVAPFTQLGGRMSQEAYYAGPLYDRVGWNANGCDLYRRRTDGMVCVRLPSAEVVLGSEANNASLDEGPVHRVWLDAFLMDQEPVSVAAYCRFLNSIGPVDAGVLADWFVLSPDDRRKGHVLVRQTPDGWTPLPGTERMPMMLVSWYGANAYSRWAHRRDWRAYRGDSIADTEGLLPSEAQWEYAARGPAPRTYPWGEADPTPQHMRFAQHRPGANYRPDTLPMADVNADLGVSPFGLRHMAGNVWQWCRDWYSPGFYETSDALGGNPVNRQPTGVRSERGGSWIGPAFLCRSSYRRGRAPAAKGRCLGFRCCGDAG
jgi:sulfatase modifying factor 1